jgi:drug/metabolite transporter (DMT)-like permease
VAIAALVGACALWGTSFAAVKICGEELVAGAGPGAPAEFGPLLLTALRFSLGLPLLLLAWAPARAWRPRRSDLKPLLLVAVPVAAGFLLQSAGLASVPATLSGFITGMCVCVTPIFEWIFFGRRPGLRLLLAISMATAGVVVMTLCSDRAGWELNRGVLLTGLCVVAFGLQIVFTGRSSEQIGPGPLTAGSFATAALAAWAAVLVCQPAGVPGALAGAACSGRFWLHFALIVVCATVGAMVLMNTFQRALRPTEAGVIYTSEPVFAGLFAVLMLGWEREMPSVTGLAGAALLLAANLVVALRARGAAGETRDDGTGITS